MSKKPKSKSEVLAALKAHAYKQAEHDAAEIDLIKTAYIAHKVPIEEIAEILGISVRTAYNRIAGKGPRAGAAWR